MSAAAEVPQINEDIWLRFQRAYATLDIELFRALHDQEFVRVETGGGWIGELDAYVDRTDRSFDKARASGDSLTIEFRFTDRLVAADTAYERGAFRVVITDHDGARRLFFGRFATVARRRAGRWLLVLDQDDDAGGVADDAMFAGAHPLDELTPWRASSLD